MKQYILPTVSGEIISPNIHSGFFLIGKVNISYNKMTHKIRVISKAIISISLAQGHCIILNRAPNNAIAMLKRKTAAR
jgi:hypothetical protein